MITLLLAPIVVVAALAQAPPPVVAATELANRRDLDGKTVQVLGRNPRFEYDRNRGWSSFQVQGSPVRFTLGPALAYSKPPSAGAILVRGTLQFAASGAVVQVNAPPEFLPADAERLDRDVAALNPTDYKSRLELADRYTRRAREYQDEELEKKSLQVAAEAIRMESDLPSSTTAERQFALVQKARERGLASNETGALVHRALKTGLAAVRTLDTARLLEKRAMELLPPEAQNAQKADLSDITAAYDREPAATYRAAAPEIRAGLDRRLLASIAQKAFDLEAGANPRNALSVADDAEKRFPDFPRIAENLRSGALEQTDVRQLRLPEVQKRAELYNKMGDPARGRELIRAWLADQRQNRLSPTDADGRLGLADQFESLLGDKAAADSLLREAWRLDPGSEEIAAAFRRRRYTRTGDEWIAPAGAAAAGDNPAESTSTTATQAPANGLDPYRNLSRDEVISRLGGKPDYVSRVLTQGEIREQWVYRREGKPPLYINFIQKPGSPDAVAIASFTGR